LHRKKKESEEIAHLHIAWPAFGNGCRRLQVGTLLQLRMRRTRQNSKSINSKFKFYYKPYLIKTKEKWQT
jgi:hypothetical protein